MQRAARASSHHREQQNRNANAAPLHTHHMPRRKTIPELVKESFPAVVIGLCLFSAGIGVTFWNEGRCVKTTQSLDEGFASTVKVGSSLQIHPENEGKLVHVWGALSCGPVLMDNYFKVQITAVKLKRRVQVYQWVEEESSVTPDERNPDVVPESTYSYSMAWKDKLVDSNSFYIPYGHENPTQIDLTTMTQTAEFVAIGAYNLSPALKETFMDFIPFSGDEPPDESYIILHSGMYYLTEDLFNPQVGEMRVQFYFAGHGGDIVSIIARQVGDTLHPHETTAGPELFLVQSGKLDPEQMFSSEHAQNRFTTWCLRLAGWFLIFIGMTCVNHILYTMVAYSRWLRDVVTMGIGSATVTLSLTISLLIIGGAWCFYRPTLAFFIFIVATLPFIRASYNQSSRSINPTISSHRTGSGGSV